MTERRAGSPARSERVEQVGVSEKRPIGILRMDNQIPRIPGDIANTSTFDFPVVFRVIPGSTNDRVVYQRDRSLLEPYLGGARELEAEGAAALTTTCGFLSMFQPELAAEVSVPVFTSSLLLVPLVQRMIGPDRRVGIITADENVLGDTHFNAAGWSPDTVKVAVRGLQDGPGFRGFIEDRPVVDTEACGREMVAAARALVAEHPDVGAIVLECTNMAPYAYLVQEATGLPVFDVQLLANLVHEATHRRRYEER
jgi:hypothetical protein